MAETQNNLRLSLHRLSDHLPLALIDTYENFECPILLGDVRTCKVTVSIYSEAARQIAINLLGTVLLKARFRGKLAFYGYVTVPGWDLAANTLEISAIGPELRLMHHYFREIDIPVIEGVYTESGEGVVGQPGFWQILESARLPTGLLDVDLPPDTPDLRIANGYDFRNPDFEPSWSPDPTKVKVGEEVWGKIVELTGGWATPDFEFEPIDELHDPNGRWAAAPADQKPIAQMNLNRQNRQWWEPGASGPDEFWESFQGGRTEVDDAAIGRKALKLHFGLGKDNLDNLKFAPDLSEMRNSVHIVANDDRRFYGIGSGSVGNRGAYEMWEIAQDDADPDYQLEQAVVGKLLMHSKPPKHLEVDLRPDTHYTYHWGEDFIVGDFVEVDAERGHYSRTGIHRIIGCTIKRDDTTKPITQHLELADELLQSTSDFDWWMELEHPEDVP